MARTRVGLTIGSSDSGGGAGIQGDVKAMASVGCYASTVLVGVTAQSTTGVTGRFTVPVDFVLAQLDAVLPDIGADAVKVGMTWSAEHVEAVATRLSTVDAPVVVDPVMVTAAGASLAGADVVGVVRALLLPLAAVVTPNRAEAELLTGLPGAPPRELAERLVALGARAAVVTCGGAEGGEWYADSGLSRGVPRPGHRTGAEHGAGCAHSALVTGLLAHGFGVREAVARATALAADGVRDGLVTVGGGVHPVDLLGLGRRAPSGSGNAFDAPGDLR
ncbi:MULTISPECIES: PfkB family carbohydrate kinase [Actinosynnema]|uniref:bifunctional hydroxymethylpyrimidine kinase/phosphomethylpyrimidine kinase n=1 Tax=Actinosynnema TaxID=40566 RepID=UPI0020A4D7C3|nr:PfkB family carbohydrate kinase [Actinosynnema pretiosum]MCP2097739.1 hydroxymethylpyrimidine/phosphomethylpyrimidine kinase [Actinosynnema pretiosum]